MTTSQPSITYLLNTEGSDLIQIQYLDKESNELGEDELVAMLDLLESVSKKL